MRIERRFTKDGQSPYADIEFRLTTSEIRNPDGSVVFKADDVEVPAFWSQVAADVLAQKYFRKAGVPARLRRVEEETVPSFLWRSVADDDGGIMDLWVREARLFKYGSGTGTNFSSLRAENEKLAGGGKSSGLMSFLKIGDRAAGAIKSGGTTRRAAKMVIVDTDHPDIEQFIDWKVREEQKVAALVTGSKINQKHLKAVLKACVNCEGSDNDWHTCPASGPIRGSNPCSEYMFLDDTACNLASLNLLTFRDEKTGNFDVAGYEHVVRLWTVVLEISVLMAQFPSKEIAQLSYEYRTLGLGYANIGGLLMSSGIGYDSDTARAIGGALTAIMTGISYATSAEMAKQLGPFPGYKKNREHMLRVIRNHRRAAHGERNNYEKVETPPVPLDHKPCPDPKMVEHAKAAWDRALKLGEEHGYRNAP